MSTTSSTTPDRAGSPFDLPEHYGEVLEATAPEDLAARVERLIDPGSASETIHWGRNYLYVTDWAGGTQAVVKQFRNQGLKARLRRSFRGSRASQNWRVGLRLLEAGIATPRPLMWIESKAAEGPSFYVSERIVDHRELRYVFRALRANEVEERFPGLDTTALFSRLGAYLRRLHDAGVLHRDLSMGNILFRGDAEAGLELQLIDLNRARLYASLGLWQRTKDLSRLPIVWDEPRRAFLSGYWGASLSASDPRVLLFRLRVAGFLAKHWFKNHVTTPLRSLLPSFGSRKPHVHIPAVPDGAPSRDKIVWDQLSDQPHQHATQLEKSKHRLADIGRHGRVARHGLPALPRALKRYRRLKRELYREPIAWGSAGVAMRPWPESPETALQLVDELGLGHVLVRLHPWQETHDDELALVRGLQERGYDIAFSLPQNRELVRDLGRWRASIERIAETFVPFGRSFQIGQAVNRSKWGVWSYDEYHDLAAAASEVLRAAGASTLLGPSVIDFEAHATAGLLNLPDDRFHFDAAAHLLYVDRRGAPENRQLGFDTVGKVALVHAIAETSPLCEPRSWITEVNWPLWEGPHSPAGRDVAVGEEAQADYLVRYYLLALGTGLVERVYWWQPIAQGYGLVSPKEGLRRRPAFHALKTLVAQLSGARFLRPLATEWPGHLYLFEVQGRCLVVGWSAGDPIRIELPEAVEHLVTRDGEERAEGAREVELTSSPTYFWLARHTPCSTEAE